MSKIVVGMATFSGRKDILPKAVDSLLNQTIKPDAIHIYSNDYKPEIKSDIVHIHTGKDLADNGKFYMLPKIDDSYFFSCDDDIFYSDNYIVSTLHYLKKYNTHFITYHGRRLKGKGLNYYHSHEVYRFNRSVNGNWLIDVPGTGVSAFHTDLIKFDPLKWKYKRMSDIYTGLELAMRNIPVLCVQHKIFWLQNLLKPEHSSIYKEEHRDCAIQNQLADEIYKLNKGTASD